MKKSYDLEEVSCSKTSEFKRRQESYIEGTPHLLLGKVKNGMQQLLVQCLTHEQIARLSSLKSDLQAIGIAKTLTSACAQLAHRYGNFLLTDKMVFKNQHNQTFVWINSNVLENKVKIYLPNTQQGYSKAVRGLVNYLKLWLKADFDCFNSACTFQQLFQALCKSKPRLSMHVMEKNYHSRELDSSFATLKKQTQSKLKKQIVSRHLSFLNRYQNYKINNTSQSTKIDAIHPVEQNIKSNKQSQNSQGDIKQTNFINLFQKKTALNGSGPMHKMKNYFLNKTTLSENKVINIAKGYNEKIKQSTGNKILADEQNKQRPQEQETTISQMQQQLNFLFSSSPQREKERIQELQQVTLEIEKLLD